MGVSLRYSTAFGDFRGQLLVRIQGRACPPPP